MEHNEWKKKIEPLIYNFDRMHNRMTVSVKAYEEMLEKMENAQVHYINRAPDALSWTLIDNGADILGVAHLDATGLHPHFMHDRIGGPYGDEIVYSRWCDDRLGVFLLLDVLQPLFKIDILLTTGEEAGQTTAKHFKPPDGKKYRWMFEPDRMGDDVVHYQYDTPQLLAALREAGFTRPSHGSFTDITALGDLGCAGFNFGIGYSDPHQDTSHANLTQTISQCARFAAFYAKNAEVDFPFDPKVVTRYYGRGNTSTFPATQSLTSAPVVNKRFVSDQVVKQIATGRIGAVSSGYGEDGSEWANKWWTRFPDPERGTSAISGCYCQSSELSADLTDEEVQRAKNLFLRDTSLNYKIKVRNAVRDNIVQPLENYTFLIAAPHPGVVHQIEEPGVTRPITINPSNAAEMKALLQECDKPISGPSMSSRAKYEKIVFGKLRSSSQFRPDRGVEQNLGNEFYFLNEKVYTPNGNGTIDCNWPCVPFVEELHWWVRFTEPDAEGLYCDLMPASTLTSRTALATTTRTIH